jgi:hypothetical protein
MLFTEDLTVNLVGVDSVDNWEGAVRSSAIPLFDAYLD